MHYPFLLLLSLSLAVCVELKDDSGFSHFITRRNDTLFDGTSIFRFISFNVPNLHLLEDHFPFTEQNNWTLPTLFEIKDAMIFIDEMVLPGVTCSTRLTARLQE